MSDNAHYLITACYQNINNVKCVPASNREIANLDGMSFALPVIITTASFALESWVWEFWYFVTICLLFIAGLHSLQ